MIELTDNATTEAIKRKLTEKRLSSQSVLFLESLPSGEAE